MQSSPATFELTTYHGARLCNRPFVFWDASHKVFGSCFGNVVLPSIATAFAIFVGIFYGFFALRINQLDKGRPYRLLDACRLALLIPAAAVPLLGPVAELLWGFGIQLPWPTVDDVYGDMNQFLAALICLMLFHAEVRKGVAESHFLRALFLVITVFLIPRTYSNFRFMLHKPDALSWLSCTNVVLFVTFVCMAASCILYVLPSADRSIPREFALDSGEEERLLPDLTRNDTAALDLGIDVKRQPETTAGFLSMITFNWLTPLIALGKRRPLDTQDIWPLHPYETSKVIATKFEASWKAEQERPPGSRSLARAVWRITYRTFTTAGFLKAIYDGMQFVAPSMLKRLVILVKESKEEETETNSWRGIGYAFMLFANAVVQTCLLQQYFHRQFRMGMRLRSMLNNAIYNKSLRLREGEGGKRNENGEVETVSKATGELVNLMTIDSQRIQDTMFTFHLFWSAPLQVIIALTMLWRLLGVATLAGVGIMLLSLPAAGFLTRKVEKIQAEANAKRDKRVKLTNEVISYMRIIKMYGWEATFAQRIEDIRQEELACLMKWRLLRAFSRLQFVAVPPLVSLTTFFVYMLLGNKLEASAAFTSVNVFDLLRFPLTFFPVVLGNLVEARLAMRRIQEYLEAPEVVVTQRPPAPERMGEVGVEAKNAKLAWGNGTVLLEDVSFQAKKGGVVAVVGETGCGKSGLLTALLGDLTPQSGSVEVKGRIAYCSQNAWIQNGTVRENIVYASEFNQTLYDKVLDVCCLKTDLEMMSAGDATEIGEKGVNMSGGQRQRIAIARAVYSQADVYLLDDVLSAVDAGVAAHIFEKCISGFLTNKTVLFVTHKLQFLPKCEGVVFLKDRKVEYAGPYSRLKNLESFIQFSADTEMRDTQTVDDTISTVSHSRTVSDRESDSEDDENVEDLFVPPKALAPGIVEPSTELIETLANYRLNERFPRKGLKEMKAQMKQRQHSMVGTMLAREKAHAVTPPQRRYMSAMPALATRKEIKSPGSPLAMERLDKKDEAKPAVNQLMIEEKTRTGNTGMGVYKDYLSGAGGLWAIFFLCLFQVTAAGSNVMANIWVSKWTDPGSKISGGCGVGIMAILVLISVLVNTTNFVVQSKIFQNCCSFFHSLLAQKVIRAPVSFFDSTPVGRLLNRFSKDIFVLDQTLPQSFEMLLSTFFFVSSTLLIIVSSTPLFLVVIVPLLFLYNWIKNYFITTSRQLQRIDIVLRSPVVQHFGESLAGVSTVRATQQEDRFRQLFREKLDLQMRAYYLSISGNRWLACRLESVSSVMVLSASILVVLSRKSLPAGLAGLAINYAMATTQSLNWLVRMASELESSISSVYSIKEYVDDTPQEAPLIIEDCRPPITWPESGEIIFDKFEFKYRPDLPLVLKGVSVKIRAGEKIGIVGRTGAGKSTILTSLLRLTEKWAGELIVDGLDISALGLKDLREKFSIIPQDPILFLGTLRFNIDPIGEADEFEIWTALNRGHLKEFVESLPDGVDTEIEEGGRNLSMGQRQLVCLTRALLRNSQILLLDEATSAVDPHTDSLIQDTIRKEFARCTVLTIAHRLNTIVDNDRVIVMSEGDVVEFDSPQTLMAKEGGIFREMCLQSGLVTEEDNSSSPAAAASK